ncbi:hypothetical protein PTNB73_02497 [Pyrenophora teres f. teres]|uniref:Uncharacterized protein n=1 Tax=Pyrenophora teres f. teres TaxID=97479 RepID=A0A6S6VJF4_9PLEO|nr:hypothetical protein HRS9139_01070 [Pyrenophora teres f. teres]KAE8848646.1 hypothetical protein PTNB85_02489 [Pyrenophora teres f. teres]KAE8853184.1 hypothetical protein HRS9122_00176 [Pyrenophora teres f. teres]KAE8868572.1 hypothetical protein PTNB29_02483 [Pyrenophora teres f. teres]KAE8873346.1 hypothetical protein PTNB73_02497 [Pyrenophora teres f. teres]
MRNYLPLTLVLLVPAVRAWNACYCTGEKKYHADETAEKCCTWDDGVTFPNYPQEVEGQWDTRVCNFKGPVTTSISVHCLSPNKERNRSKADLSKENDAIEGFAKCCRLTGGSKVWGGSCCHVQPDGSCT